MKCSLRRSPSSACAAYKVNFNDNFDIFYGGRKLFQENEVHWSSLGVKTLCNNLLHGLQIVPLKCLYASKALKYGAWGKSVNQWCPPKEEDQPPPSPYKYFFFYSRDIRTCVNSTVIYRFIFIDLGQTHGPRTI